MGRRTPGSASPGTLSFRALEALQGGHQLLAGQGVEDEPGGHVPVPRVGAQGQAGRTLALEGQGGQEDTGLRQGQPQAGDLPRRQRHLPAPVRCRREGRPFVLQLGRGQRNVVGRRQEEADRPRGGGGQIERRAGLRRGQQAPDLVGAGAIGVVAHKPDGQAFPALALTIRGPRALGAFATWAGRGPSPPGTRPGRRDAARLGPEE